jgi:hypothetical protein
MLPRPTYAPDAPPLPTPDANPWNDFWRGVDDDIESRRDEVTGFWRSVEDRIERMDP